MRCSGSAQKGQGQEDDTGSLLAGQMGLVQAARTHGGNYGPLLQELALMSHLCASANASQEVKRILGRSATDVGRSPQWLDVQLWRQAERRVLSISYAMGCLAVLTVVHTDRDGAVRVISFRHASREEREAYHAWLEDECDEA